MHFFKGLISECIEIARFRCIPMHFHLDLVNDYIDLLNFR